MGASSFGDLGMPASLPGAGRNVQMVSSACCCTAPDGSKEAAVRRCGDAGWGWGRDVPQKVTGGQAGEALL